jgi:8-oxo-dGTP pyrophosphatase MutT (NUDIX family)
MGEHEMNAREMFEELGYELVKINKYEICFTKELNDGNRYGIEFDIERNDVDYYVVQDGFRFYGNDYDNKTNRAIHQQMKELGWLD